MTNQEAIIHNSSFSRRSFLKKGIIGATALSPQLLPAKPVKASPLLLGFDNFSIRALQWKAPRLIEFAVEQKVDSLLLSDLDVYESLDSAYLRELKQEVKKQNILLQVGTGSICPTSQKFSKKYGSAEEHLKLLIKTAASLGSPVARCYLGSKKDRMPPLGISYHIETTLRELKKVRSYALDMGVKLAIENHAGDMHSSELIELIEKAGQEFVGATLDTGNATWTLEDPLETFRVLAPYAISSGVRDSMVWKSRRGAKVQWTALGEGCVDLVRIFQEWAKKCPHCPVQVETISGFAKEFPFLEKQFWTAYSTIYAADFASFLRLAHQGKEIPTFSPASGADQEKKRQAYQLQELQKSLSYCRAQFAQIKS